MCKKYDERVELHCHSWYSKMDGANSVDEIIDFVAEQKMSAVAFTEHGSVLGFSEIKEVAEDYKEVKAIYGVEAYVVNDVSLDLSKFNVLLQDKSMQEDLKYKDSIRKFRDSYHISLLAKNDEGKRTLQKLTERAYSEFYFRRPKLPLSMILKNRENLFIGSACEAGLLGRAIREGVPYEKLKEIAGIYDYLEVQPGNEMLWMIGHTGEEKIHSVDDIRIYNDKIIALGVELDIPVVATGDVHFLRPKNAADRSELMRIVGYENYNEQNNLYFRTTSEMLREFEYLGDKKAFEIVVENTNRIAEQIKYQ